MHGVLDNGIFTIISYNFLAKKPSHCCKKLIGHHASEQCLYIQCSALNTDYTYYTYSAVLHIEFLTMNMHTHTTKNGLYY